MEVNMNFLAVASTRETANTERQPNTRDINSTKGNDFKNELNQASNAASKTNNTANETVKDKKVNSQESKNDAAESKLNNDDKPDNVQDNKETTAESKTDAAKAQKSADTAKTQKSDAENKASDNVNVSEAADSTDEEQNKKISTDINDVLQELLLMLQNQNLSVPDKQEDKQVQTQNKAEALNGIVKKLEMLLTKINDKVNSLKAGDTNIADTSIADTSIADTSIADISTDKLEQFAEALKQLIVKLNKSNTLQESSSTQNQSSITELTKEISTAADILTEMKDIIGNNKKTGTDSKEKISETDKSQAQAESPKIVKDLRLNFNNQKYKVQPVKAAENEKIVSDNKTTASSDNIEQTADDSSSNASDAVNTSKAEVKVIAEDNKVDGNFNVKLDNIQKEADIKVSDTVIEKTEKKADVPKTEIIDQVIKKAEVLLKDGKSEMNIKLEPEHLGKLSLKIEVDKGVVTAKFVTENPQVKNELESNLNQLKNILQEKGISVQSFSVSVGQEGKEFNSKNNMNIWKEKLKDTNKRILSDNFIELDNLITDNKVNPYIYHEGTIDYKA